VADFFGLLADSHKSNGHTSKREEIFSLDIVKDSDLTRKLTSFGLGNSEMVHFRIEGNNGSRLDFVANAVSVTE